MSLRPYWSVLVDSYREAKSSKVLWVILSLIAMFLIGLAPTGMREELTTTFSTNEIYDFPKLAAEIRAAGAAEEPSPGKIIWERLDPRVQKQVNTLLDSRPAAPSDDGDRPPGEMFRALAEFGKTMEEFTEAVEAMLKEPDFYDPRAWRPYRMRAEARELIAEGVEKLDPKKTARLNRLALEAAFPGLIQSSPPTSLSFTYLVWDTGDPLPLPKDKLLELLNQWVPYLMDWVVSFGTLILVLVTAPIVPQMFEPGSLHLLLSKPVSRSLLFLSKFFGGCIFALLCAGLAFTGIWLIFGTRLGYWYWGFLWAIPIYTFVFAIYYAVSVFAGLIHRNTILSVVYTILFFLTCWLLGISQWAIEGQLDNRRLTRVVPAGEALFAATDSGSVFLWDESESVWEDSFQSDFQRRLGMMGNFVRLPSLGPIYAGDEQRLLAVQAQLEGTPQMVLAVGKQEDDWRNRTGATVPQDSFALLTEPDGGVLLLSYSAGIRRLTGDPLDTSKPPSFLGFRLGEGGPFEEAGPPRGDLMLSMPISVDLDPRTGRLAILSRGMLSLLERDEGGKYAVVKQQKLDMTDQEPALIAFAGEYLVAPRESGDVLQLDAKSLEVVATHRLEGETPVRFVVSSPDGARTALVFHNRRLWMLDAAAKTCEQATLWSQGDINSAAFTPEGNLLVADRVNRVRELKADWSIAANHTPSLAFGSLEWWYRYTVSPPSHLFPKPGEFWRVVQYLVTGKSMSSSLESSLMNLNAASGRQLNPWRPLWSGALFMLVMLGLGCLYIEWLDF